MSGAEGNGLQTLFDDRKKLIFIGGKGGVGKSSTASSIAYRLSREFSTLLVSTDPAHSIGDSLMEDVSSGNTSIDLPGQRLHARELDATVAFQEFKHKHEDEIRLLFDTSTNFDNEDIDQIMSLMLPGIDEVMGLKSIVDILQSNTYDKVVVDTAPTGHALRLLFMPGVLNAWIKMMAAMRWKYRLVQKTFKGKYTPDEADDLLLDLKRTVSRMNTILSDKEQCEFVLVTIPNEMALNETERLHNQLTSNGVSVGTLIINHIAPDSEDPFYKEWHQNQATVVKKTSEKFHQLNVVQVPLFPKEIHGRECIELFEKMLFEQN